MRIVIALGLAAVFVTTACKKNSAAGAGGPVAMCTPASAITPIASPGFAADIYPIFDASCNSSACHDAASPKAGLNLSSASISYAELVNQATEDNSCIGTRVLPGDSANSVLGKRLSGSSCGLRMPNNGACLDQGRITMILSWIDQGALNN